MSLDQTMVELASAALAQRGFDPAKTPDLSGNPFCGDGGSGTGAMLVPDFMDALATAGSDEARKTRIYAIIKAVDDSANEHDANVLGHAKKTVTDLKDGELAFLASYLKATRSIDADPNETDRPVFKVEYDPPPADTPGRKRAERPVRTGAASVDRDDAGDRTGRKGRDRNEERTDRDDHGGKNKDNGKDNDSSWQADEAKKARKAAEKLAEEVEAARVRRVAAAKAQAEADIAATFAAADRAKEEEKKAPTVVPAADEKPKTTENMMADIQEITEEDFKKKQKADAAAHGGHGGHGAEDGGHDAAPHDRWAAPILILSLCFGTSMIIAMCGGVWHYWIS